MRAARITSFEVFVSFSDLNIIKYPFCGVPALWFSVLFCSWFFLSALKQARKNNRGFEKSWHRTKRKIVGGTCVLLRQNSKQHFLRTEGKEKHHTTGCVTKMYPIFESKWLTTFSKLSTGFYTIVKKMKFCTGPDKLQLPNMNNFDTVISPKWPAKTAFTSLFLTESGCPREFLLPSFVFHLWVEIVRRYVFLSEI